MMVPNHWASILGVTSRGMSWRQLAMKATGASPMAAKGSGMAFPISSHASKTSSGRTVLLGRPCATNSSLGM
eukprot:14462016-Heterocapsa_arctica.AAC.1